MAMRAVVVIAASATLSMLIPSVCRAEGSEAELVELLQREREKGSAISDEQFTETIKAFRRRERLAEEMSTELSWTPAPPKGNPAAHTAPLSHLVGKEGVPFPTSAESKWEPSPTRIPTPPSARPVPPAPTPKPYQRPSHCEKSETRRTVYRPDEPEQNVFTDYLFIAEDLVPLSPDEVLGSKVSLITYGPNSGEASYIRMEIYNVPCLPYRMRMTNTAQYVDMGLNALKNYDADPAGKGTLHPIMQQKVGARRGK